jgi:hypothetical protein
MTARSQLVRVWILLVSLTCLPHCGGDRVKNILESLDDDAMTEIVAEQAFTTYHNKTITITTNNYQIGFNCGSDVTFELDTTGLCYSRSGGECMVETKQGEIKVSGNYNMCSTNPDMPLGEGQGVEDLNGLDALTIDGHIKAQGETQAGVEYESTDCSYTFHFSDISVTGNNVAAGIDFQVSMGLDGALQCGSRPERTFSKNIDFTLQAYAEIN